MSPAEGGAPRPQRVDSDDLLEYRDSARVARHGRADEEDPGMFDKAGYRSSKDSQAKMIKDPLRWSQKAANKAAPQAESVEIDEGSLSDLEGGNCEQSGVMKEGGNTQDIRDNIRHYDDEPAESPSLDRRGGLAPPSLTRLNPEHLADFQDEEAVVIGDDMGGQGLAAPYMIRDANGQYRLVEGPASGDQIHYLDDGQGGMLRLEEIDPEQLDVEYADQEASAPELVFVDEKKELVYEANLVRKVLSRGTIIAIVVTTILLWVEDYFYTSKLWTKHSYLWQGAFAASHVFSLFVLQPLLLWLHAFFMASGLYRWLACKNMTIVQRLYPMSLMLYLDLLHQSQVLADLRNRRSLVKAARPEQSEEDQ